MLSTYTSYDLIARNMLDSIKRTSQEAITARDSAYYKENIGKITSVDEFLDDYRLYSYAMKAYGLEEMTYARAFMRQVLESDLTDANSFANRLSESRYREFAAAFSFAGNETAVAQTESQMDELIGLYTADAGNTSAAIREETRYYNIVIDQVTNVDQLLRNDRLRDYVFTSFGIDERTYSYERIRGALTSDLDDPNSYFNTTFGPQISAAQARGQVALDELEKLQSRDDSLVKIVNLQSTIASAEANRATLAQEIATLEAENGDPEIIAAKREQLATMDASIATNKTDLATHQTNVAELDAVLVPRTQAAARKTALVDEINAQNKIITSFSAYQELAAAFEFNADGTLPAGTTAQTAENKKTLNEMYTFSNPRVTSEAALLNRSYYESKIGSIKTIGELTSDPRLLSYVKVAFDLNGVTIVKATIEQILEADLSDPDNYIERTGGANKEKYLALRNAFNFLPDGTLPEGQPAQTAAQTKKTNDGYMVHYNDKDDAADEKAISLFRSQIVAVTSVSDFLSESSVYTFALKAVGIDPTKVSALTIKNVLMSDLNDPRSYVYTLRDPRFVELAKAFNFDKQGNIDVPVLAQSQAEIVVMSKAYVTEKSRFGTDDDKKAAEEESKYYASQMEKIESLDQFLADQRLVNFVLEANGIDPEGVTAEFMRQIFTSDIDDPDSFVNTQPERAYRKIATAFNFNAEGQVVKPEDGQIQTQRGIYQTIDSYIRQIMEEDAGTENAGVRLALYFQRMASTVTSPYDILADDALMEVFRVTFGLPAEIANADVDAQASMIENYLDLQDLQDSEEVRKMIVRFAVLYDLENAPFDPVLSIFSNSGSAGISGDLLMSIAQLRPGGI
ncbi:MAG: DUF1217 domain-containing protein [Shinella sp.]|nr:DUF1217 domain-containing protein [Shinella sp.]